MQSTIRLSLTERVSLRMRLPIGMMLTLTLKSYKISAISSMIHRAIDISSSYSLMHKEFEFIRDISKQNGYPNNFVQCQIRHVLNRHIERQKKFNKPNKDIIRKKSEEKHHRTNETRTDIMLLNLPFVAKATQQFSKEINKLTKKGKATTKVITIARSPPPVGRILKNKDEIPKVFRSHVVYQLSSTTCSAKYIAKTVREVCRRLKEHGTPANITTIRSSQALRRSTRIYENKRLEICYAEMDSSEEENFTPLTIARSAVKRHIIATNHKIDWKDCSILDEDHHPYRLLIKESMGITKNCASLNLSSRSVPLIVYPEGGRRERTQTIPHVQ